MPKSEKKLILNSYIPLVEFLSRVLGSSCEIVLHSVTDKQERIEAINDNNLTGRKKGSIMSPVGQKVLELNQDQNYILNNMEKALKGRDIRSNTFFIKDSSGEMIGMLCINFDISAPLILRKYLDEWIGQISSGSTEDNLHSAGIEEYVLALINETLKQTSIAPERMNPDEKKQIIKELNEKGIFRIKGGIAEVCRHLQISEATLYRYLKDIK